MFGFSHNTHTQISSLPPLEMGRYRICGNSISPDGFVPQILNPLYTDPCWPLPIL